MWFVVISVFLGVVLDFAFTEGLQELHTLPLLVQTAIPLHTSVDHVKEATYI